MTYSTAYLRSPLGLFSGQLAPRLYDRVVEVLRTRHYRRRTEEAYVQQCGAHFVPVESGTRGKELRTSRRVRSVRGLCQTQVCPAVAITPQTGPPAYAWVISPDGLRNRTG